MRRGSFAIILLAAASSTGAAAEDQPPAAVEANARWYACARSEAAALDDGISDARTIGAAASQACQQWRVKLIAAYPFHSQTAARRALDEILAQDIDRATLFVVEARKAHRQPQPPPPRQKPKGEGI